MSEAQPQFETHRTGYALATGLVALVLAAVGAIVFTSEPEMVKLAADSTALNFVLLTFYISISISLIGYRLLADERPDFTPLEKLAEHQVRKDWIGRFSVSFALSWLLVIACQAFFVLGVGKLFPDAEVPRIIIMLLFVVYGGVLGFIVAYFIVWIDDVEMNWLLISLAVDGLLFSATVLADPSWWQRSVSALGIDSGSGTFFNITVIVVGLVALTIGRDLIADLKLLTEAKLFPTRGFEIVRLGITGIGLGIVGVGLFPTEGLSFSNGLHLLSAYGVSILCVLGMLGLHLIVPNIYDARFTLVSRVMGGGAVMVALSHFFGPLGFTPMELILFAICGVWIFYFRHATKQYVRQQVIEAFGAVPFKR